MTATVELIIFLFTLMFSVPRDWNHRYYSILNKKLERKQLLPFKDYASEIGNIWCCEFNTKYLYWSISILGSVMTVLYIMRVRTDSLDLIITTLFCTNVFVLVYNHFCMEYITSIIDEIQTVYADLIDCDYNIHSHTKNIMEHTSLFID
eukprot:722975_1